MTPTVEQLAASAEAACIGTALANYEAEMRRAMRVDMDAITVGVAKASQGRRLARGLA